MRNSIKTFVNSILIIWLVSVPISTALAAEVQNIPQLFRESGAQTGTVLPGDSVITITHALEKVALRNPQLKAARAAVSGAEGRLLQSRKLPNPNLSIEVANFGRNSASGPQETTVGIIQPLELFGKRGARKEIAFHLFEAQNLEYDQVSLKVYRETAIAYYSLLASQQILKYSESQLELARQVFDAVNIKVTDGAAPRSELLRAESAVRLAEINVAEANAELDRSRIALSMQWGEADTSIVATGELDWWLNTNLPQNYLALLDSNKEIQTQAALLDASKAAVRLSRALGKPDIAVGAGYRRLHDEKQNGFLAWLSLPLPLFNRNQGGIAEAVSTVARNEALVQFARIRISGDLQSILKTLENQRNRVTILREKVLPPAEQALNEIDEAYRLGSQPYINVLDAQRTLAEIQIQTIEALMAGVIAATEIEIILGQRLK